MKVYAAEGFSFLRVLGLSGTAECKMTKNQRESLQANREGYHLFGFFTYKSKCQADTEEKKRTYLADSHITDMEKI